ncbi:MAG: YceI family protein [Myxococcales bacterium]
MTISPSVNETSNVPSANSPRSGATAVSVARTYEIDVSHSSATFKVRHMMVANVRGDLGHITGQVVIDEAEFSRSSVEARIEVATINTRDPKRDEHLRSGDFLDIANHPQITFNSKRVTPGKGDNLFVVGDLTIRGVTREVTLNVESISPEVNDPWGNVRRGVAARARINRKDFNIVWNAALDGGGVVVGDEIAIDLELELTRKP